MPGSEGTSPPMTSTPSAAMARALRSLDGLSLGDAYGECFLRNWGDCIDESSAARPDMIPLPDGPWAWTDDTAMAAELVHHLREHGSVRPDELSGGFARTYMRDPHRGYGASVQRLLVEIYAGKPWREAATEPFGGMGSMGNGSAMRAAPLGAWLADALEVPAIILVEADRSAAVTHAHPEGIAGAQAVALAAALAARTAPGEFPEVLWSNILGVLPDSLVRRGIEAAASIPGDAPLAEVAAELGNGSQILCIDTVPVCLWLAAHNGGNFELAMRRTAAISGDIDTNCAIVGGIISLLDGMELPAEWRRRRMPVPLLED